MTEIKTLAMLKMEKNFRGHIEKKYPRNPYEHYDLSFWRMRLRQELKEFEDALKKRDFSGIKEELADISNLVDFAFERTLIEQKFAEKHPVPKALLLDESGLDQLFKENKDVPDE